MISFDLNDLKKTNDNYGHEAGDQLLTDFSSLLAEIFSEKYLACRMGGDEFLVILPKEDEAAPKVLIDRMLKRCSQINETRKPLPLSYAYGYCRSTDPAVATGAGREGSDLVSEVYKCSDERMYAHKMEMKSRRS